MRTASFATLIASVVLTAPAYAAPGAAIQAAIANPARQDAERLRDRYRHPAETLDFFGVAPGQTLIEYSPGGGWYTRILMPLLAGNGRYVAVVSNDPRSTENARKLVAGLPGGAAAFVTTFDPATATMAAPNSADRVLTFRNVHNLLMAEDGGDKDGKVALAFFRAAYKALKPGGVLGVVDHRLPEGATARREETSGYVKKSTVVRLATAAGFRLDGESEINANPKDTTDWPKGVWTLPPSLQLGEQDRAKYLAIGESDRMTLRFVKPR
ncbi:class I SAM-dependent methyltransferase [Sphingomonas crusticola]|uniref:class I SAM-dependent methyltransferase n=1 Tax=Sphingomonas crusticola TaxID=1697973 RepID=UPI000E27406D|nr:class I SAM-dependent methyltransferase [Sphingomonas crusticola]